MRILAAAFTGFLLAAGAASFLAAEPAVAADLAAAKAAVDAAKAAGTVGEQGDGYLGFVNGSADPATMAAVNAINAGRRQAFESAAARTGVTPDAAGQATAAQLIAQLPPGQYYKPVGGGWTRK